MELDFEIDKITESIEDAKTGENLATIVEPVNEADLKGINKKNEWLFDWKLEFSNPVRQVCKLIVENEPNTIHGLVSFTKHEDHLLMNLIENASFNIGEDKKYFGVAANLIAYVCKMSMEYGFSGIIAFEPKTALISHYEKTLGAVQISSGRMAIFEKNAKILINRYFPK
jgi:hypothetical protein